VRLDGGRERNMDRDSRGRERHRAGDGEIQHRVELSDRRPRRIAHDRRPGSRHRPARPDADGVHVWNFADVRIVWQRRRHRQLHHQRASWVRMECDEQRAWVVVSAGAQGSGNGTVSFTVERNSGTAGRSAAIAVADKSYSITQSGAALLCEYSVAPVQFNPCMPSGTLTATITVRDQQVRITQAGS
jgi:hypothetical protein